MSSVSEATADIIFFYPAPYVDVLVDYVAWGEAIRGSEGLLPGGIPEMEGDMRSSNNGGC